MRSNWWRGWRWPPRRIANASIRRARPPAVVNVVSSTSESPRYARAHAVAPRGVIAKWPPRSQSRMRPKQLERSKRVRHAQSTLPSRDTRAAEWQSASSA